MTQLRKTRVTSSMPKWHHRLRSRVQVGRKLSTSTLNTRSAKGLLLPQSFPLRNLPSLSRCKTASKRARMSSVLHHRNSSAEAITRIVQIRLKRLGSWLRRAGLEAVSTITIRSRLVVPLCSLETSKSWAIRCWSLPQDKTFRTRSRQGLAELEELHLQATFITAELVPSALTRTICTPMAPPLKPRSLIKTSVGKVCRGTSRCQWLARVQTSLEADKHQLNRDSHTLTSLSRGRVEERAHSQQVTITWWMLSRPRPYHASTKAKPMQHSREPTRTRQI